MTGEARLQHRHLDLFVPEAGIGVRDPTEVLAPDPQMTFGRLGAHPRIDRHLQEGDRVELVFPHPILGGRARVPTRLPDRGQQRVAEARLTADVRERGVTQAAEPIPVVVVEEVECEITASNHLGDRFQRYSTLLQPQEEACPPHVPTREGGRVVGL